MLSNHLNLPLFIKNSYVINLMKKIEIWFYYVAMASIELAI